MDDPMLTLAECAQTLDVPLATLVPMRYLSNSPMPQRSGGVVRYRLSEVRQWLTLTTANNTHPPPPAPLPETGNTLLT